ncbi:glycosyltransferase family 2 protein [Magnetococcales bacterium HHB-1]
MSTPPKKEEINLAQWVAQGEEGLLSIVVPAHNEEGNLVKLIPNLSRVLTDADIHHEILVVNDCSTDGTEEELHTLEKTFPQLRHVNTTPPNGFGLAVRHGLREFRGDKVLIMMADSSDAPEDAVAFYRALQQGYDCAFGSRFISGGKTIDYPPHKWVLNRLANLFIRLLFNIPYNDITNAFKGYQRHVIAGLYPFLSYHFNLTVELPLKAIIRGYSYTILPNSWQNRTTGLPKLKIREMGSRYLFIVLYCFLEKWLSRGDYRITSHHLKKEDDTKTPSSDAS